VRHWPTTGVIAALAFFVGVLSVTAWQNYHHGATVDSDLRAAAASINHSLRQPVAGIPEQAPVRQSFDTYVTRLRAVLDEAVSPVSGLLAQAMVVDPTSTPRRTCLVAARMQSVDVCAPAGSVPVPAGLLRRSVTSGDSGFVTIRYRGEKLRAYVTPLKPPQALAERGMVGVLELFQRAAACCHLGTIAHTSSCGCAPLCARKSRSSSPLVNPGRGRNDSALRHG